MSRRAQLFWGVTEPVVAFGVGLFICWHVARGAVASLLRA